MKHQSRVGNAKKANSPWFSLQLREPGRWALMLFSEQRGVAVTGCRNLIALQLFKLELSWTVCKSYKPHHSWSEHTSCNSGINIRLRRTLSQKYSSLASLPSIYVQHFSSPSLFSYREPKTLLSTLHLLWWLFSEFLLTRQRVTWLLFPGLSTALSGWWNSYTLFPFSHHAPNFFSLFSSPKPICLRYHSLRDLLNDHSQYDKSLYVER